MVPGHPRGHPPGQPGVCETVRRVFRLISRSGFVALVLMFSQSAMSADTMTPNEWLDQMASAVRSIDFEGTVIRRRNGQSEALKVFHKTVDGVVHEKIITQEGNGLEIIRNGNEVHCILPDRKAVLIEHWNDDSSLFSTLPGGELQFGSEYDLSIVREERVAGRLTLLLAIRPHDGYRFGHRIWLDQETGFPLRTELVAGDGALIEQLKFADIRLNSTIPQSALLPSFDLNGFTWYEEPARTEVVDVESEWLSEDVPAGFRLVSMTREMSSEDQSSVIHIMYSDGIAMVSVFVAAMRDGSVVERSAVGASNSFSIERDNYLITAEGEVPPATVKLLASSMRRH